MAHSEPSAWAPEIGNALDRWRTSVRRMWMKAQVYRATLVELKRLTDRDLADLGLDRSMLRTLAREAADKV